MEKLVVTTSVVRKAALLRHRRPKPLLRTLFGKVFSAYHPLAALSLSLVVVRP